MLFKNSTINNHIKETKPQQASQNYKNFKLPTLKLSKPQFSYKAMRDFEKSISQKKLNTPHYKTSQINKEMLQKLKVISLIKTDKQSLSAIPIIQNYSAYRGMHQGLQTQLKRSQNRKCSHSNTNKYKTPTSVRNKTQQPQNVFVVRVNMNINLNFYGKGVKMYHNTNPSSHRQHKYKNRSLTQQIQKYNRNQQIKTEVRTIRQCKGEDQPQVINELIYEQKQQLLKCQLKFKPAAKQKMDIKKQHKNTDFLNASVRGWTRYAKVIEPQYQGLSQNQLIQ